VLTRNTNHEGREEYEGHERKQYFVFVAFDSLRELRGSPLIVGVL